MVLCSVSARNFLLSLTLPAICSGQNLSQESAPCCPQQFELKHTNTHGHPNGGKKTSISQPLLINIYPLLPFYLKLWEFTLKWVRIPSVKNYCKYEIELYISRGISVKILLDRVTSKSFLRYWKKIAENKNTLHVAYKIGVVCYRQPSGLEFWQGAD